MASSPSNPSTPVIAGHLHYGGSLGAKTGKLGSKPRPGGAFRTQKRFETIVRLENAGFPDAAIAAMISISPTRLQTIKKSPDYLAARILLTHGIILDNDKKLAQIKEQRKEIFTQNLPTALQVLANEILMPAHTLAERKHKVAVALELLDREGTFAKVSRTEIKPVDHFDFEEADAESASIIKALTSVAGTTAAGSSKDKLVAGSSVAGEFSGHTEEAVAANKEFSNSHTLSAVDQQKALEQLEEAAALEIEAGEVDEELLATLTPATEKVQ